METDSEGENEKSFAALTNVFTESEANYQHKFEQFLIGERSDDDSDDDDEANHDTLDQEEEQEGIDQNFVANFLDDPHISTTSVECTLKSEELEIIESCQHKELKNLLHMNRSKNFMLMQLFKKIKDMIIDCRTNIELTKKNSKEASSLPGTSMFLTHLAAPYFKTKKEMFSSAPNKDILSQRQNGELSIYQNDVSPKWSKNECENLISGVKLTYNHNKQKAILKQISPLKFKLERELSNSPTALEIIAEIERLQEELKELKTLGTKDIPLLGHDDFIDWEHISSEYLQEKHTGLECRAFWHIYLHPDINKSNWTVAENIRIKELAQQYNQQDWDQIALELGTKRSGFSVCLHYLSVLSDQFSRVRFTKEEDIMILNHVERMKIGSYIPWNAIESYFPNRSRNQLMHRYKYFLKDSDHGTESFTDAEDILVLILVNRFGRHYSKFSHFVPNRSYMQVKNRYDNHLRINTERGSFTIDEDETIVHYMANKRAHSFGRLSYLLTRTRGQIRQRYKTLKAFLDKYPNGNLCDAPRRFNSGNEAGRRLEFLKCIAEQFKDHYDVPTLEEIEQKLGVLSTKPRGKQKKNYENYNVDALLINFFSNSYKLKKKPVETTIIKIREASDTVFDILTKWKVNIQIPEDIKKNHLLDVIDIEILTSLKEKYDRLNVDNSLAVDDLIPPNMNTMIGLRALLLRNQLYKSTKNRVRIDLTHKLPPIRNMSDNRLALELIDMLKEMSSEGRNQVENERCLFLERFLSLFMWPAIFSIESPSEQLLDAELGIQNMENSTEIQQKDVTKKKKVAKEVDEPVAKKIKLIKNFKKEDIPTRMSHRSKRVSTRLKNTTADLAKSEDLLVPGNIEKLNEHSSKKIEISTITDNLHNLSPLNQVGPTKMMKITQIRSKSNMAENREIRNHEETNEVPQTLRRVEKSEFEKILKSKKPLKMFMLQKIKMEDGSFKTIRKSCTGNRLPMSTKLNTTGDQHNNTSNKSTLKSNIQNLNENSKESTFSKKLSGNNTILDIISLADSLKQKSSRIETEAHGIPELISTDIKDLNKLKNILTSNIKQYTENASSTLSTSNRMTPKKLAPCNLTIRKKVLETSVMKDKQDVTKLDHFLSNLERDDDEIVDLTESEVTKNEVQLLNELIKIESNI